MKIKRTSVFICILVFAASILGSCAILDTPTENSEATLLIGDSRTEESTPYSTPLNGEDVSAVFSDTLSAPSYAKIGDDLPVSRGLAAKMLALVFYDKNSIDGLDREIEFTDTSPDDWYDRYINACVTIGIMNGSGTSFEPRSPLTLLQAQTLLDRLDENNPIKIQITEENGGKPISYALWTDLYLQALGNISEKDLSLETGFSAINDELGISALSIIILASPENNSSLPEFNLISDTGAMTYYGLSMTGYIDKQLTVLKKDSEIIAVLDVVSETPTIKNAYIVKAADVGVTIFAGGAERTYTYASRPEKSVDGTICDIKISSGTILEITSYKENITGLIKKVTRDYVELFEYGRVPLAKGAAHYSTENDSVRLRSISSLIVGTDAAEFICRNGEIIASLITKTPSPQNIRVAISATGYAGLIHSAVRLTATTDFSVRISSSETKFFKAGEIFVISESENPDLFGKPRIYVNAPGGKIQLLSVGRNWANGESPLYRGSVEIGLENGGYSIVNEISMEEYLYAVVPSEMPTAHGVEAAKVQAVTARSFAYNQFYANRFHSYGAQVDDSVSCQVYNNIPENETSVQAANETAGQCITYNGTVITANFFSTSSGMTANSGEVWASGTTRQFPTSSAEYLKSVKQHTGDYGDLSKEENAEKFFKDLSVESYDSAFSWFRWNVSMTTAELTASVNASLKARYDISPKLIKTLMTEGAAKGQYRSRPITTIGELVDLEITARGEGGNILTMKITGTEATVLVSTEYNIRLLLRPKGENIVINRFDGTALINYSLLPSAFFVMEKEYSEGVLTGVTFYGGGNGHGVGMSQNGVKGMIDKGFSAEEILVHYYPGTKIEKMY